MYSKHLLILCTNSCLETFNKFKAKHKNNLLKQGYSQNSLTHIPTRSNSSTGHMTLKQKLTNRIVFTSRYTPSTSKAFKITTKYWPELQQINSFKTSKPPCPMIAYRSNKNIKSFLVRARLLPLDCHIGCDAPSHITSVVPQCQLCQLCLTYRWICNMYLWLLDKCPFDVARKLDGLRGKRLWDF